MLGPVHAAALLRACRKQRDQMHAELGFALANGTLTHQDSLAVQAELALLDDAIRMLWQLAADALAVPGGGGGGRSGGGGEQGSSGSGGAGGARDGGSGHDGGQEQAGTEQLNWSEIARTLVLRGIQGSGHQGK